jgi:hypothetical protein
LNLQVSMTNPDKASHSVTARKARTRLVICNLDDEEIPLSPVDEPPAGPGFERSSETNVQRPADHVTTPANSASTGNDETNQRVWRGKYC